MQSAFLFAKIRKLVIFTMVDALRHIPDQDFDFSEKLSHDLLGLVATWSLVLSRLDHGLRSHEKPGFNKNEHHRPFLDVIMEGIEAYKKKFPDKELSYHQLDGRITLERFKEILTSKINSEDLSQFPHYFERKQEFTNLTILAGLKKIIFDNLVSKSSSHGNLINILKDLFLTKVQKPTALKIIEAHGYIDPELSRFGIESVDDRNKPIYDELIRLYEMTTAHEEKPQSLSLAISFLLEKYDGNLNQTWNMLANFCKYVTRDKKLVDEAGEWFQSNLLDEFSPYFPYTDLVKDQSGGKGPLLSTIHLFSRMLGIKDRATDYWADGSLVNQIGKVYHAAYLLSMLEAVDAQVLALLTTAEYVVYGVDHGPNKAMADALILQNLLRLEKLFTSESTQEH